MSASVHQSSTSLMCQRTTLGSLIQSCIEGPVISVSGGGLGVDMGVEVDMGMEASASLIY